MREHTPSFTLKTAVDSLDVDQALSATTTMKHVLLGTARAAVDVKGNGTTQPEVERTLTGTVRFAVRNGDLRNYPILSTINAALGVAQGSTSDTKFDSLAGTAVLGGGVAKTNDLILAARGLTIAGGGTVGFDQHLDLKLATSIAPGTTQSNELTTLTQRLTGSHGSVQIPLTIGGTSTSPKIGVDVKSVAKQQLPGLLKKIF
jgi:hypothetical protein